MKKHGVMIVGTGYMSEKIANVIAGMPNLEVTCVVSRTEERGRDFAQQVGAKEWRKMEEGWAKRPADADFVYIATPNHNHLPAALEAMEAGMNVMMEKPFALNAAEAREMVAVARKNNVLLAEAIWTRYMPIMKRTRKLIEEGLIGQPQNALAWLSYAIADRERIKRADMGGGALLDLGVYPLNFALMMLGHPEKMTAQCQKNEYGVDTQVAMQLHYGNGAPLASLMASVKSVSGKNAVINGEKGYIWVDNVNCPSLVRAFDASEREVVTLRTGSENPYEWELLEMVRCIDEGRKECPSMPLDETIRVMEWLDEARHQTGVRFDREGKN